MEKGQNSGRTHEPNLRELTVELEGLRDWIQSELRRLEDVAEQRELRTVERNEAMEKFNAAINASADKAIGKSEKAQEDYNKLHNDLSRKGDQDRREFASRHEVDERFQRVDKDNDEVKSEISKLRESFGAYGGRMTQQDISKQTNQWSVTTVISIVSALTAVLSLIGVAVIALVKT